MLISSIILHEWLGPFLWFRKKQQLHILHHHHANCNFAVIDYFWDRLLGTYRGVEATRQAAPGASTTREIGVGREGHDLLQSRRRRREAGGTGPIPRIT